MDAPSRSSDEPIDMQADFFDPLSAGELARLGGTLADNVLVLLPGLRPVHGRARATRLLGLLRRRFVTIEWTHGSSLDAGPGWLISTWTVAGQRADGSVFRSEVASVARLAADGRIAYLSDYFKSSVRSTDAGQRGLPEARDRSTSAPP